MQHLQSECTTTAPRVISRSSGWPWSRGSRVRPVSKSALIYYRHCHLFSTASRHAYWFSPTHLRVGGSPPSRTWQALCSPPDPNPQVCDDSEDHRACDVVAARSADGSTPSAHTVQAVIESRWRAEVTIPHLRNDEQLFWAHSRGITTDLMRVVLGGSLDTRVARTLVGEHRISCGIMNLELVFRSRARL